MNVPVLGDICLVQFSLAGKVQIIHDDRMFDLVPGPPLCAHSRSSVRYRFDEGCKLFTFKVPMPTLEALLADQIACPSHSIKFSA